MPCVSRSDSEGSTSTPGSARSHVFVQTCGAACAQEAVNVLCTARGDCDLKLRKVGRERRLCVGVAGWQLGAVDAAAIVGGRHQHCKEVQEATQKNKNKQHVCKSVRTCDIEKQPDKNSNRRWHSQKQGLGSTAVAITKAPPLGV